MKKCATEKNGAARVENYGSGNMKDAKDMQEKMIYDKLFTVGRS